MQVHFQTKHVYIFAISLRRASDFSLKEIEIRIQCPSK